jgi:hypothetical protein
VPPPLANHPHSLYQHLTHLLLSLSTSTIPFPHTQCYGGRSHSPCPDDLVCLAMSCRARAEEERVSRLQSVAEEREAFIKKQREEAAKAEELRRVEVRACLRTGAQGCVRWSLSPQLVDAHACWSL